MQAPAPGHSQLIPQQAGEYVLPQLRLRLGLGVHLGACLSALSFIIAAAAITPDKWELLSNVLFVCKYLSARS